MDNLNMMLGPFVIVGVEFVVAFLLVRNKPENEREHAFYRYWHTMMLVSLVFFAVAR